MSEIMNDAQGQKPKGRNLANVSLVFAILSFLYAFLGLPIDVNFVDIMIGVVLCLAGFILGMVSLVKMNTVKNTLGECIRPILGIVICALLFFLFLSVFYASQDRRKLELAYKVVCRAHLGAIGAVILIYSDDFDGKYPTTDKWCDLLVQSGDIDEKQFVCRSALKGGDKGRCHYAMNPNCEPNSSADTVLLFETKGGWNQYGGPELLTFENHKGKGCNILFNDGHVKFVVTKRIGELKWKAEKF